MNYSKSSIVFILIVYCHMDYSLTMVHGILSALRDKSPFSPLMLLSTMVGEGKNTICPQVKEGTPEYFADQTNIISDPEYLKALYSTGQRPRKTKNAQDFMKNITSNGNHQFQPPQDQDIGDACINIAPCDPNAKWRTFNGECNNARFPMWGTAGTPLVRLIPAQYEDKKDQIRLGANGQPLMNPRKLHLRTFSDKPVEGKTLSYGFMMWTQLVSHDTARIMDQRPEKGPTCLCCTNEGEMIEEDQRATVCLPIETAADDPFYSKHKIRCMNFVRSLTTNEMDCIIEPDQPLDDVSHFVDASVVYGSTKKKCDSLREFKDGRLRVVLQNGTELMPNVDNPEKTCFRSPTTCFAAGDDRVNQNNMLSVIQLMLVRYHNFVCKQLQDFNPHWDDNRLFNEARIIIMAMVQHITYEHMLPIIIGPGFAVSQNLSGATHLRSDLYQPFLNPGTLVSFTSAAYRLMHSLIPSKITLCKKDGTVTEEHMLSDTFFKPDLITREGKLDEYIYGMVHQATNEMNTGMTTEVTNLMFKSDLKHGIDLVSLDMQRNREHGGPSYVFLRVACGMSKPKDFADLADVMTPEKIKLLQSVYNQVDDIDAYVAMFMENLIPETLTGPLMRCIISEQFLRWQAGDIFYYTFNNSNNPLTEAKLQEILKTSLSMVFCISGNNIEQMPRNSFLTPGKGNEMVPCSEIPKMSFQPWKE